MRLARSCDFLFAQVDFGNRDEQDIDDDETGVVADFQVVITFEKLQQLSPLMFLQFT